MPESEAALRLGCERFDRGSHFDAHEVWEARWRVSADPEERRLLQGLIQVAAGYYKALEQRRPASAAVLLRRGLAKLEACAPRAGGLALAEFCAAVRAGLAALEGRQGGLTAPRLGLPEVVVEVEGEVVGEVVGEVGSAQASGPKIMRRP